MPVSEFGLLYEAIVFYFSSFRSEKNTKSNEGGRKKTFTKKNIEPIFGKVNEGDEIKNKTFDKFLEKLMRAKTNKQKKHSWRNVFLFREINLFFRNLFIIS